MKKFVGLALILGGLAACTAQTPNDVYGAGDAGFEAARRAQAQRDAALTGQPVLVTEITPGQTAVSTPQTVGAPTANVDGQPIPLTAVVAEVPVDASPSNPAPVAVARTGAISDEQNFDAVADRESIESDAARIAANRSQYQVVQVQALPQRQGGVPNIVDYALATNHPKGVKLYRRAGVNLDNRSVRNCQKYASSDQAQQDFLARGGPDRDRLSLDPDGDGYACRWDPAPFRLVRN